MSFEGEMKAYPSVTEVLSHYQDFSRVSESRLEAARIRGTVVDRFCKLYANGLWPVVPEIYEGYFVSFKKWWLTVVDLTKPVDMDLELIDENWGFIGHPDFILTLKGEDWRSVWDLKTPVAHYPTWKAQLAAYKHLGIRAKLLNSNSRCGSVMLNANGRKPRVEPYEDNKRDLAAFVAALTAHNYFKRR